MFEFMSGWLFGVATTGMLVFSFNRKLRSMVCDALTVLKLSLSKNTTGIEEAKIFHETLDVMYVHEGRRYHTYLPYYPDSTIAELDFIAYDTNGTQVNLGIDPRVGMMSSPLQMGLSTVLCSDAMTGSEDMIDPDMVVCHTGRTRKVEDYERVF